MKSYAKTLRAIDWQNQQLNKQTKAITEAASRIQEAGFQIGEITSKINETLKETKKETQDIAPVFVYTKTAKTLHDMGAQTNPQLKLNLVDLTTRRYKNERC